MRATVMMILTVALLVLALPALAAQKVETVDGVRVVHNSGPGAWGKTPKVTLEPVRSIGEIEATDENLAFYLPSCIAVDAAGRIYVLDSGNHRVQKFEPDGKYLATIGRQGQGPAEFYYPSWLTLDFRGDLYVSDPNNNRIQVLTPEGKDRKTIRFLEGLTGDAFWTKSGELVMSPPRMRFSFMDEEGGKKKELPKLVKVVDGEGKVVRGFGTPHDFGDDLVNDSANDVLVAVDPDGGAALVFPLQNRVERFGPDGRLLWRADRELSYGMEIKEKGKVDRRGGGVSVQLPRMNRSANGLAVDGQGRTWVATLARQLKKEEEVSTAVTMMGSVGGGRTIGYKAEGNTELRTTDAFKLEVFGPDGVLLGAIPISIFVDGVFIFGDRLFLLDKMRGATVHEFKIKE